MSAQTDKGTMVVAKYRDGRVTAARYFRDHEEKAARLLVKSLAARGVTCKLTKTTPGGAR